MIFRRNKTSQPDFFSIYLGCIKKRFTVGKYSVNEQERKIGENFQSSWEVRHSLVHPGPKLFENLSFSK